MESMNFLKNRLLRRFGPAGRLADVAVVGGAALKYAQRKGYLTDETARKLGAAESSAGSKLSIGELLLVAFALYRLIKQVAAKRGRAVVVDV